MRIVNRGLLLDLFRDYVRIPRQARDERPLVVTHSTSSGQGACLSGVALAKPGSNHTSGFMISFMFFLNIQSDNIFLAVIQNNTFDGHYKYSSSDPSQEFLVVPLSAKQVLNFTEITEDTLMLNSIKGNNPPIFLRKGQGFTSGDTGNSKILPGYLELWTDDPSALSNNKQYIRFYVKPNDISRGFLGLRIEVDGSPRLFPVRNIEFLDKKLIVQDDSTQNDQLQSESEDKDAESDKATLQSSTTESTQLTAEDAVNQS